MKKIIALIIIISTFSCEEIINEQNITNDSIHLVAPTENVSLKTSEKIIFNWEALNGATAYKLQIATPNFINATQLLTDTLVQRVDFSIETLLINNYEWRVKGMNSAYETVFTTNGFIVESN